MALQRLNWDPRNHEALNDCLAGARPGDIAVFDWDNTCIFGDIGEAVLRWQTLHLGFKFGPEQLQEIIPDQVRGIDRIRSNGRILLLPEVKEQIVSAYKKISGQPAAECMASRAYRDFCAGLLALNCALEATPGIGCEFAYPWTINFLAGFTPVEVCHLAAEVIDHELHSRIRECSISDSGERLRYQWTSGIRSFPEMTDLARFFKKAGGRVIVSTASNPLFIETMAQRTGFAAESVIGMASAIENGLLSGTLIYGSTPNFGPGKVENLRRLLEQEPLFIAGDSDGDYEMVTSFAATRLNLLIRREHPGKMAALYQKARAGDRRYLLQDVDRSTGQFAPGAT